MGKRAYSRSVGGGDCDVPTAPFYCRPAISFPVNRDLCANEKASCDLFFPFACLVSGVELLKLFIVKEAKTGRPADLLRQFIQRAVSTLGV